MGINDNLLDDVLEEVGNEKSDIDKVITISSPKNEAKEIKVKPKEKKPNNKVGVYITDEEKKDFMQLCGFFEKRATEIGRELILKFIKENDETLKKLEKLKSE